MTLKYDVIIIGAGANGMCAGAYLAKAGLRVALVEKRLEAGGGLATEEVTIPGYYHNTHSIFHMMVDFAPPYHDLKLEEDYGLKYIYPSLQVALPLADGRCLCLYNDVDKSCESIAQFSKKDAESYRELHHKLNRYMSDFLGPATYARPVPPLEQAFLLEANPMGHELMAYSEKSPKDIVFGLFENEVVRTMMLYLACQWGLGYDVDGVGYLALLYLNRAANARLCRGGSHRVSQALYKVIHENGGAVQTSKLIKRIVVTDGAARGVELADGTLLEAKVVMSSIDLHQTFFKMVGKQHLSGDLVESLEAWRWEKWSLLQMHQAISEPGPKFSVADANPEINQAYLYMIGYESPDDLIGQWDAIERGELSRKVCFSASFPSVLDPTQAPRGKTTGLFSQMVPFDLKDGGADKWYSLKLKEDLFDRYVDRISEYAPNINRETVMWGKVHTPIDIRNKLLNMVKGSIKQGEYHPLQMGYSRPNADCSDCRTPIKNLYLCGATVHSGGLITFGPGYLAANAVAEDLGVQKWWPEPEGVKRAREAGLLPVPE